MKTKYQQIYERVVSESIPLIFIIIVGIAAVGLSDFALPDQAPDNQTQNLSEVQNLTLKVNQTVNQSNTTTPNHNLTELREKGRQCFNQYNKSQQINQCIKNRTK